MALARKVLKERLVMLPGLSRRISLLRLMLSLWRASRRRRRRARESGLPLPQALVLSPTYRCNLSCSGCCRGPVRNELSLDAWNSICNEAKSIGINFFVVTGGEPFLWEPLPDLLDAHKDAAFLIFTNGTALRPALADHLVAVGNTCILFSVEGTKEATNARRGPGVYEEVCNAMEMMHERSLLFGFAAMCTRSNLDVITSEEFVRSWHRRGCRVAWYTRYGQVDESAPDWAISSEEGRRLVDRCEALGKRIPIHFFCDEERCMSGWYFLHINPQGLLEPCPAVHYGVDSVLEKGLMNVIASPFMRHVRQVVSDIRDTQEPCLFQNKAALERVLAHQGSDQTVSAEKEMGGVRDEASITLGARTPNAPSDGTAHDHQGSARGALRDV